MLDATMKSSRKEVNTMKMIWNEYRNNKKFRDYVDKYCTKHGITVAEALQHELVRQKFLMDTDV